MSGATTETRIAFRSARQGWRVLGEARKTESLPRVPRVARLLALAIRVESLVRNGEVADYAELTRLGQVSKARLSQLMRMLCLAPDIQEAILLPATASGRDPVTERQLQRILAEADWRSVPEVSGWISERTAWETLPRLQFE